MREPDEVAAHHQVKVNQSRRLRIVEGIFQTHSEGAVDDGEGLRLCGSYVTRATSSMAWRLKIDFRATPCSFQQSSKARRFLMRFMPVGCREGESSRSRPESSRRRVDGVEVMVAVVATVATM